MIGDSVAIGAGYAGIGWLPERLDVLASDIRSDRPDLNSATMAQMTDSELAARIGVGDEAGFGILVSRHLPRLLSVARRMLGSDHEAEDVAQEALLRLWRNAAGLDIPEGGLGGWLYRVTSNLSLDRLRARRPEAPDALDDLVVAPEQERTLDDAKLAAVVDGALQALPERQRLAITLCHYEGLSMKEAAEIIGTSDEAIESLLARARRALKKALEPQWQERLDELL